MQINIYHKPLSTTYAKQRVGSNTRKLFTECSLTNGGMQFKVEVTDE